jgi:hypothetical protein
MDTSQKAHRITKGQLAGAIVGSIIGVVLLGFGLYLLRRQILQRQHKAQKTTSESADGKKNSGFDGKAELPPNVLSELPGYQEPSELHSTGFVAEMPAHFPIAELPEEGRSISLPR